ncbi:DUF3515 family protein [Streptomyces sp. NPDC003077]|uniref:DUF3515 family protein n=1 Tax=Streptomyces sp. NPDC003077 TaxID=3154443 RepID=UPI0033A8946C
MRPRTDVTFPERHQRPHANSPLCHETARKYPARLLDEDRSPTDLPGVAVWGDGTTVLRCGVTPLRPTPDPCFTVNGVDWVLDEARSKGEEKVLTTYGRVPAIEVIFSGTSATPGDGLVDLSGAIGGIPQQRRCL